jgi:hypothetical protein
MLDNGAMTPHEASRERGYLYRVMDFHRVVQIFRKGELHFAHPNTWDDPYEKFIKHPRSHALFAQCWTRAYASDAMWRIYSPHGLGVRISTSEARLNAFGQEFAKKHKYTWRSDEVQYYTLPSFRNKAQELAADLNENFSMERAADALYMKRDAFSHEDEWRATLYCPDQSETKSGIKVPVDAHELIRNILLDPRAPGELVDAFTVYFRKELGFKGLVKRSELYASPRPLEIADPGEL